MNSNEDTLTRAALNSTLHRTYGKYISLNEISTILFEIKAPVLQHVLTCKVPTMNDLSTVPALINPGDHGNGRKKRGIHDDSTGVKG